MPSTHRCHHTRHRSLSARVRRAAAAAAVVTGVLGAGSAAVAAAPAVAHDRSHAPAYRFVTRDNAQDPTFNQLLGINDRGTVAGYFGSGAAGHPNKGYLLIPFGDQSFYINENFPGSVQTQVTGLNDRGVTVGFWSSMNNANLVNDNHAFWAHDGVYHPADFPTGSPASPPVDQLLGVNDRDVAVGFYTDAANVNHGYELDLRRNEYSSVVDPQAPDASLTAAAINSRGDIAGFYTNAAGATEGFVLSHHHRFAELAYPGAISTMASGINNDGEVVGVVSFGSANNPVLHGFTWTPEHGFALVDDPNGVGATTVNGVNDRGQLVGFYTDAAGNTDGFVATPTRW